MKTRTTERFHDLDSPLSREFDADRAARERRLEAAVADAHRAFESDAGAAGDADMTQSDGRHVTGNPPDDAPPTGARLEGPLARAFLTAGNATFTIVSRKTGTRFTFKLRRPDPKKEDAARWGTVTRKPIFISVLSGPDNTADYAYLGTIWEDAEKFTYAHGRKSRIAFNAPSAVAAEFVAKLLNRPELGAHCEVWHEGRCGRCGRKLTVPESVRSGIGPECAGRL